MCQTYTRLKGKYGPRSEARLGLFCRHMSPLTVYGDKEEERPAGPPPSRPVFAAGEQSGPRLRAPPAGRASALAGDPSPWPAQAAFDVRRPGMAAARTAATLFKGGRCGCLLAVINSQQRNRGEAAALRPAPGGEAAVRFKQPMGPARCAHWRGRELAPCVLTPGHCPGLLPPCPPAGGVKKVSSYSACLPL